MLIDKYKKQIEINIIDKYDKHYTHVQRSIVNQNDCLQCTLSNKSALQTVKSAL